MKPKLTPRQRMFVEAYAGNATEAAKAAGYSEKTAYAQGSRLLRHVEVAAAIKRREDRITGKLTMKLAEAQGTLSEIARDEAAKEETRVTAIRALGRISGWDRLEVKVDGSFADILKKARERAHQR